jgi:hypothetical protein
MGPIHTAIRVFLFYFPSSANTYLSANCKLQAASAAKASSKHSHFIIYIKRKKLISATRKQNSAHLV